MSGVSQIEPGTDSRQDAVVSSLAAALESDGVVVLPPLFAEHQVREMRRAFEARLGGVRWNNVDGYERERLRLVVQDVLTVEQGFVDLAVHPLVTKIVSRYVGADFTLTEAKGWKSLPTKRDFQGWHGDQWYDEKGVAGVAKEVKLAMYLTDVRSGAFNYIKGSHQKQHPRLVPNDEVEDIPKSRIMEIEGRAGTSFLFDSSGIHKQGVPVLQPRLAVFYNYHDPIVPLLKEAIDYYRYHPLILNAAFLGDLSAEAQRVLGFGSKIGYVPAFQRKTEHKLLYRAINRAFGVSLMINDSWERFVNRVNRITKRTGRGGGKYTY